MATDPARTLNEFLSFADFLAAISGGAVVDELTSAMSTLVKQVQETGRKGSVRLSIEVSAYKGNKRTVEVAASTDVRLPRADSYAGVFYPDRHGLLHRNDPAQPQLPLAEVLHEDERPVV